MKLLAALSKFAGNDIHRLFAKLHGVEIGGAATREDQNELPEDFPSVYAAYATATAHANAMLQQHGARSKEFMTADIGSMRLFHRAKKMQGLKKPRSGES